MLFGVVGYVSEVERDLWCRRHCDGLGMKDLFRNRERMTWSTQDLCFLR